MLRLRAAAAVLAVAIYTFTGTSATFYVSTSGNDSHHGLSETGPLRSIGAALQRSTDGDRILLRRGDAFRHADERDGRFTLRQRITLGAYGAISERPTLAGSVRISSWRRHSGNVYVADVSDTIRMLYVDDELMLFARYPNSGWLRPTVDSDNGSVLCPELMNHPRNRSGYWAGATMRYRPWSWWFAQSKVLDYNASTGELTVNRGGPPKGWGFYLDNKLEELDTAGEWFFDTSAMQVYLYPPDGENPNSLLVEGVVVKSAILNWATDTRIENIRFKHYWANAIYMNKPIHLHRCRFQGIGSDKGYAAVSCWRNLSYDFDARNSTITNCMFRDLICPAITWCESRDEHNSTLFEYDTLINVMHVPGYGSQGSQNWSNSGIALYCAQNLHIRYCYLENIGYAGILLGSDGNYAEYNILKRCMSALNDGGAIYTNCNRSHIRHNLIFDTRAGMAETGSGEWADIAHGIWPEFLEDWRGTVIENNTVVNSSANGLFLPNNFECIVRGNVFFGNSRSQMYLSSKADNSGRTGRSTDHPQNHLIENNVFYATDSNQHSFHFVMKHPTDYGILRNNYYCNPHRDNVVTEWESWGTRRSRITFDYWQAHYTWADAYPKTDPMKRPPGATKEDLRGLPRLLINDSRRTRSFPLEQGAYVDLDGNPVVGSVELAPYSSTVVVHTGELRGHGGEDAAAGMVAFTVKQAALGKLRIVYSAEAQVRVSLTVFNTAGRKVCTPLKGVLLPQGTHTRVLDTQRLPRRMAAGLYHCVLTVGDERHVRAIDRQALVLR